MNFESRKKIHKKKTKIKILNKMLFLNHLLGAQGVRVEEVSGVKTK